MSQEETTVRAARLRKILDNICVGFAIVAIVGFLLIVGLPRVLGLEGLAVLSGSMKPEIPTGSFVLVDPIDSREGAEQVKVGDVVTFLPYPDNPTSVTHRVVSIAATTDGPVLTTQGDALASVDPWETTATQLRGVVRHHIPYAGYVTNFLDGQTKQTLWTVGLGGIGVYIAYQVLAGVRDKARARHATIGAASEPAAATP